MQFILQADVSQKVLDIVFIASILLYLLQSKSGSLIFLVNLINALQMVAHLPILQIVLPATVMYFLKAILPFVMFDVLDYFGFAEMLFEFNYD